MIDWPVSRGKGTGVAETMWHYALDGATVGPVTHADLCARFADRDLPLETQVWHDAAADWAAAYTVEDFRGIWGKGGFGRRGTTPPPLPQAADASGRPGNSTTFPAPSHHDPVAPAAVRPRLAGGMATHVHPVREGETDVPQARPWVRYWARWVDRIVMACAAGLLVLLLRPTDPFYFLFIAAALFVVEAMILSMFGTTVGKGILGISVETLNGERPTILQAMGREVAVQVWGRGLGIVLVGLYTMLHAYRCVMREGGTHYDQSRGLLVRYQRIGVGRVVVALLVCAGSIGAVAMTIPAATWERTGAEGDTFGGISFSGVRRSMAAAIDAGPATQQATQPAGPKKPRPKPKLLTLPSDKGAAKLPGKAIVPTTRPARRQNRPAPRVIFKPAPPPPES